MSKTLIQNINDCIIEIAKDIKSFRSQINTIYSEKEKTLAVASSYGGELIVKETSLFNNVIFLSIQSKDKINFVFNTDLSSCVKTTENNKDIYTLTYTSGEESKTDILTNKPKTNTYYSMVSTKDPFTTIGYIRLAIDGSIAFIFNAGFDTSLLPEDISFNTPLTYIKA